MAVTKLISAGEPGPFGPGRTFEAVVESPNKATVKVNGQDLASVIRGFDFRAGVGDFPRVVLELAVHVARIEAEQIEVVMNTGTHDLLVAAGWTPPTLAGPASEQL